MGATVASEQLFEAMLSTLDVAVVVEDADGRVLASNPAADRLLGPGCTAMHEDGWPLSRDAWPGAVALRTGDPDVLLHTDLGVRHALRALGVADGRRLAEACRPFGSYATLQLWRSLSAPPAASSGSSR